MSRSSGVLMHVTSLPGSHSIGCFGREARDFIDLLADSGFTWWQVLPFCMADECNSPYKSYSAFSGNPYFIDLDILVKKGLITPDRMPTVGDHFMEGKVGYHYRDGRHFFSREDWNVYFKFLDAKFKD